MNRYLKSALLVTTDLFLLVGSFLLALKVSKTSIGWSFSAGVINLALITGIQLSVFFRFGLYRAVLRFASIDFLITVLKAVTFSSVAVVCVLYLISVQVSLSVVFLDWLFSVFFVGGFRFIVRYYIELKQRYLTGKRVLIYGAGDMGSLALTQLTANKSVIYSPVGFIDDDVSKTGLVVRGVKVVGTPSELENIITRHNVEEVVVAIAELDSERLKDVVKRCKNKGIVCRIIPCFSRLLEIEPDIRNVELADLMRRTPRDLDNESIRKILENRIVMVTGAAGSIGSEIVRQCLRYGPLKVLALDQSEYGLYCLQEELGDKCVGYILCDITNKENLKNVFKNNKIDVVFHAAAYKHVPLLEMNPSEGVRNNITCTRNVCEFSHIYGIKKFVMISSDKAVKPLSVMGSTKRICELIVQNYDVSSSTVFISVRFGNVLGSSGSVVPKFIEQIKKGGPLTVTHPEATRYFMLIDEAAQLVLQAAAIGKGREIFVLDMGKPVRIVDMAEDLMYLMGRQPHKDIKIEFTGLRPGEKIHEELFNDEIEKSTRFKEITVAKSKAIETGWLEQKLDALVRASYGEDKAELLSCMTEIGV